MVHHPKNVLINPKNAHQSKQHFAATKHSRTSRYRTHSKQRECRTRPKRRVHLISDCRLSVTADRENTRRRRYGDELVHVLSARADPVFQQRERERDAIYLGKIQTYVKGIQIGVKAPRALKTGRRSKKY